MDETFFILSFMAVSKQKDIENLSNCGSKMYFNRFFSDSARTSYHYCSYSILAIYAYVSFRWHRVCTHQAAIPLSLIYWWKWPRAVPAWMR